MGRLCMSYSWARHSLYRYSCECPAHVFAFQFQTCTRCISAWSISAHMLTRTLSKLEVFASGAGNTWKLAAVHFCICALLHHALLHSCNFARACFHMQKCNDTRADLEVLNWWRWGFIWTCIRSRWAERHLIYTNRSVTKVKHSSMLCKQLLLRESSHNTRKSKNAQ